MSLYTIEVSEPVSESRLGSSSRSIDDVLEAVSGTKELVILNVILFISVHKGNGIDLLLIDLESKSVEDLAEDLGGDLEGSVSIVILEEALGIESVLANDLTEGIDDLLADIGLLTGGTATSISRHGASHADGGVKVLFKTLGSEDLVDVVREFSPLDVLALLRGLVELAEHQELRLRDGHLGHGEADAELSSCDVARSETIEITEELSDSDALLGALSTDASEDILNIIGAVANDFSLADTCLSLGNVVSAVVNSLADSKKLLSAIDILTEVAIVTFVNIALVHVSAEEFLNNVLGRSDTKSIEHSKELILGHMAILCDIVVLEDRFQVDALGLDRSSVLLKDLLNLGIVLDSCKVLATGQKRVVLSHSGDTSSRGLVDSSNGESRVDVSDESLVSEEALRVGSLVLLGESLEFIVGKSKVHRGED